MWLDNDFSIQFISPGTKFNDRELNYIVRLEKVEYTLIIILSFLSIYILILLISANWVIYLFIEIQTRYRHFIMAGSKPRIGGFLGRRPGYSGGRYC